MFHEDPKTVARVVCVGGITGMCSFSHGDGCLRGTLMNERDQLLERARVMLIHATNIIKAATQILEDSKETERRADHVANP